MGWQGADGAAEDVVTPGDDQGQGLPAWLSPGARVPVRYLDVDDRTTATEALARIRTVVEPLKHLSINLSTF